MATSRRGSGSPTPDADAEKARPASPPQSRLRRLVLGREPQKDPGPPPDRGLDAWTQALMGHLVSFSMWGYLTSFGVFQTYYTTTLGESESAISWIGSLQTFLLFFVGAFSGRALDAGYYRPVYVSGVVFVVVGVFTASVSTQYYQVLLSQGVCVGLGTGLSFAPTVGLVSTYFETHRTLAIAFVLTGAGTGGMVFPAIVEQLLPKIGFGWTMRVLGFIILGTSLVTLAFLRVRLPSRDTGAFIDWASFKDAPYMLYLVGMFFNFWALYFALYYVGTYASDILGIGYDESVYLLIAQNAAGIPGRIVHALIADRFLGPLNTIMPAALVTAIVYFSWAAIDDIGGLWAFAVFYGFFSNAVQGIFPAALVTLTDDISKTGARIGMGFTLVSFPVLTGAPLGGALIASDNGRYLYAQMWGGACFILGTSILLVARFKKTGLVIMAKM